MPQMLSDSVVPVIGVSFEVSEGIARIMSEPLDEVREKVLKEKLVPEEKVDEAILEYRKFLCLALLGYRQLAMCSQEVDWIWHIHILFTKDYHTFCDGVFGEYFHHQPKTSKTPLVEGAVERFYQAYKEIYGDVPQIWGAEADGCSGCAGSGACSGSCSCDGD